MYLFLSVQLMWAPAEVSQKRTPVTQCTEMHAGRDDSAANAV